MMGIAIDKVTEFCARLDHAQSDADRQDVLRWILHAQATEKESIATLKQWLSTVKILNFENEALKAEIIQLKLERDLAVRDLTVEVEALRAENTALKQNMQPLVAAQEAVDNSNSPDKFWLQVRRLTEATSKANQCPSSDESDMCSSPSGSLDSPHSVETDVSTQYNSPRCQRWAPVKVTPPMVTRQVTFSPVKVTPPMVTSTPPTIVSTTPPPYWSRQEVRRRSEVLAASIQVRG